MRRKVFVKVILSGLAAGMMLIGLGIAGADSLWSELGGGLRQAQTLPDFVALAARLSPAVVNISTVQKATASSDENTSPEDDSDPFDRFGQPFEHYGLPQPHSLGSGFIINPTGYILTNDHVIEDARQILVSLKDGRQFTARLVGRDSKTDVALLKINPGKDLPVAPLGNSDDIKVGEWVMAIGNPFGFDHSVTAGIVSAEGRFIPGNYDDFIQTDASINPGNSGGPLIDLSGAVVAVNSAIYTRTGSNMGIGFAIPINLVKAELPQLSASGRVVRGWLGVYIEQVPADAALRDKIAEVRGAMISEVIDNGPAAAAGLRRGDIIVEFDHHPVGDSQELPLLVGAVPIGRTVKLKVLRSGAAREIPITVAPSGEAQLERASLRNEEAYGLKVEDLTPQLARELDLGDTRGLLVSSIAAGSAAEHAGLHARDVILEVNRKPISNLGSYERALKASAPGKIVLLLIKRDNRTLFIPLKREG
ncbi:MAG TPA: Do family serine endopeptidase [Candidatus Binataceae bacterium]|nr:Do family serine endopeptidase [Candidatus Binataceae bacterium]